MTTYNKLPIFEFHLQDLHKQEDQRPDLSFKCEIPYSFCHGGKDLWQSWLGVQHDSTHRCLENWVVIEYLYSKFFFFFDNNCK